MSGEPVAWAVAGGLAVQGIAKSAGTCRGDSGGGLITADPTPRLIGIASWTARNCGQSGGPDVFTYVPAYAEWIRDTIGTMSPSLESS